MKALTIRQPWAWAIVHAKKDVENREWNCHYRGEIAIHAAKGCTKLEYEDAASQINRISGDCRPVPDLLNLERGAIIAVATIMECVTWSASPWFCGPHGIVLRNVRPLEVPIPCSGALGLWEVPPDVERMVRQRLCHSEVQQ